MKKLRRIIACVLATAMLIWTLPTAPQSTFADGGAPASSSSGVDSAIYSASANGLTEGFSHLVQDNASLAPARIGGKIGGAATAGAGMAFTIYSLANDGLSAQSQGGQVVQALIISADLTLGMVGLALVVAGATAGGIPLLVAAVLVGLADAFLTSQTGGEWLDGLFKPSNDTGVYKPNIYLYTEERTEVELTFARPELVTVSIPEYADGWTATAENGTVTVDGETYGFLFYEALTNPALYDYEEAFFIPRDGRAEVLRAILAGYNFTERETADFIEFWDAMLGEDDFLMYPQLTDTIDRTMPLETSVEFAEYFRIWFAFRVFDGQDYAEATPVFFDRTNRNTLLEWGGFFVK